MNDVNLADTADDEVRARREFLKRAGKYAVVVPPAMALLLTATSKPAFATHGPVHTVPPTDR